MNKFISSFILVLCFVFVSRADIMYPDGRAPETRPSWIAKIGQGAANFIFAPLEIPKTFFEATEKYGVLDTRQFTEGLIGGFYNTAMRFGHGAHQMGTSAGDEKPLFHLEPETLSFTDAIPGYMNQFEWESIDGPSYRLLP